MLKKFFIIIINIVILKRAIFCISISILSFEDLSKVKRNNLFRYIFNYENIMCCGSLNMAISNFKRSFNYGKCFNFKNFYILCWKVVFISDLKINFFCIEILCAKKLAIRWILCIKFILIWVVVLIGFVLWSWYKYNIRERKFLVINKNYKRFKRGE